MDDLTSERSVLLIEWGEKFERFRRERDVEIVLEVTGENERSIKIAVSGSVVVPTDWKK
jgi:tRNA A37 threonylcarbamoyladenosine biosynthesis protein TsaE